MELLFLTGMLVIFLSECAVYKAEGEGSGRETVPSFLQAVL